MSSEQDWLIDLTAEFAEAGVPAARKAEFKKATKLVSKYSSHFGRKKEKKSTGNGGADESNDKPDEENGLKNNDAEDEVSIGEGYFSNLFINFKKFQLFSIALIAFSILLMIGFILIEFYELYGYIANICVVVGLLCGLGLSFYSHRFLLVKARKKTKYLHVSKKSDADIQDGSNDSRGNASGNENVADRRFLIKHQRIFTLFCVYLILSILVTMALFITCVIYAGLFPQNYRNYCEEYECHHSVSDITEIFGVIIVLLFGCVWFVTMLFYIKIICVVLINLVVFPAKPINPLDTTGEFYKWVNGCFYKQCVQFAFSFHKSHKAYCSMRLFIKK